MDYTPHIGFRAQHCQKKVKLKSVTWNMSESHMSMAVMYSRVRAGSSMSDGQKRREMARTLGGIFARLLPVKHAFVAG